MPIRRPIPTTERSGQAQPPSGAAKRSPAGGVFVLTRRVWRPAASSRTRARSGGTNAAQALFEALDLNAEALNVPREERDTGCTRSIRSAARAGQTCFPLAFAGYPCLNRATVRMPLAVRPMAIPRCSTRPSRCRRLRSLSETVPARAPAVAMWINAVASCGFNSTSGLRSNSALQVPGPVRVQEMGVWPDGAGQGDRPQIRRTATR
jgi:hypothetical protein